MLVVFSPVFVAKNNFLLYFQRSFNLKFLIYQKSFNLKFLIYLISKFAALPKFSLLKNSVSIHLAGLIYVRTGIMKLINRINIGVIKIKHQLTGNFWQLRYFLFSPISLFAEMQNYSSMISREHQKKQSTHYHSHFLAFPFSVFNLKLIW